VNPEPAALVTGDEYQPSEESDEDSFLPNFGPQCISSWTDHVLRSCQHLPDDKVGFEYEFEIERSTDERMQEQLELLGILFRDFYHLKLFARGLPLRPLDHTVRSLVPVQDKIDVALFVDYLPMLRVMATTDTELRATALAAVFADPSSSTRTASSKRSTRNSSRRAENRHFLSDLVPLTQFDEDAVGNNASVPAIVRRLTKLALHRSPLL
jgi:hypothetical protein